MVLECGDIDLARLLQARARSLCFGWLPPSAVQPSPPSGTATLLLHATVPCMLGNHVFFVMPHSVLGALLQKHEKARQEHVNADELDENFIRLYWEQMLQVRGWG